MSFINFEKTTAGWAAYFDGTLTGVILPCRCCEDLLFQPQRGVNFPPHVLAEIQEFMFGKMAERLAEPT